MPIVNGQGGSRSATGLDTDGWTPYKFLLEGSFCLLQEINPELNRAREEAGASFLLLLATDERAFLRSLTLFAPESSKHGSSLARLLHTVSVSEELPELRELIQLAATEPTPMNCKELLLALASFARDRGRASVEHWLGQHDRWRVVPSTEAIRRGRIATVLLARDAMSDADLGTAPLVDPNRALKIAAMVNSTVQADVRRDTAIMASLGDTLQRPPPSDGSIDAALDQAVRALVGLSVEVSSSDAAAYYVPQRGRSRLERAAVSHADDEQAISFPKFVAASSRSVVAACMREHRTIQMPPGLGREQEVRITARPATGCIELATPVTGPMGSPRGMAVGVLTVVKAATSTDGRSTGYGSYDLALVRNISLRLALLGAAAKTELTARTFARSGMRSPASRPQLTARWGDSARDEEGGVTVPKDIEEVLPAITGGLQRIAEMTGSHSATFRAALPNWDSAEVHGLALMRVAAFPAERLRDPYRILTQEDGGVTWHVALSGKPKHAAVVDDEGTYREARQGTASELCLPVYVEGRLIGVVNLESLSPRSYEEVTPMAWLLAEHVAGEITNARLAMTQRIQEHAHELVGTAHEIAADCEGLRNLSGALSPESAVEVRQRADRIEKKARAFNQVVRGRMHKSRRETLPELVERAMDEAAISFVVPEVDPLAPWQPHPPQHGELIKATLYDMLVNVKSYSTIDSAERRLRLRRAVWGGRAHEIVTVWNAPNNPISRYDAVNLYRIPVFKHIELLDERGRPTSAELPHLGAYLAGARMRLIGGDVYLSRDENASTVRVTLILPEWCPDAR